MDVIVFRFWHLIKRSLAREEFFPATENPFSMDRFQHPLERAGDFRSDCFPVYPF